MDDRSTTSPALHNASGRFARGFNCAQSVFAAFSERFGIAGPVALRMSAPFGGGMGRAGEVCGALTGALMVLGLQYGQDRPEGKDEMYRITREFVAEFQESHGAVRCNELIGYDISTPEGMQAARENDRFGTLCPLLVTDTARALERYLIEHPTN